MLSLLGPYKVYLILGMSALVFLAGGYTGYKFGNSKYQSLLIKIQQEQLAEIKDYQDAARELAAKNQDLEQKVSDLDEQAHNDPDANTNGISASSVQRLNSIR